MAYKTIKELAEMTGVTESALRYYDRKGILQPTEKKATGRREWLYDESAVRRLEELMIYRRAGIPVECIGEILGEEVQVKVEKLRQHLTRLRLARNEQDRQISVTEMIIIMEGLGELDGNLRYRLISEVLRNEEETV
ncbi:MAG: MerR family DNA-binding transcriptional regulator [Clostridiales bacterium]|nr:MerR family DNA-binding transcriptional regulator [Clostridiales bacterium]MDD7035795.1 MerR family DNA-binding transcriptional regulator [Bacillota bacterium]MDY2920180.1 MerR family DNA-binding transcriptional regulator [Lentihominibacter sp.]